jgi:hypothetical protein
MNRGPFYRVSKILSYITRERLQTRFVALIFSTDLFLTEKLKMQGQTLVVQNEMLEFIVTLQNPYIFDLELQQLSLR